jgi:hypothetical protein
MTTPASSRPRLRQRAAFALVALVALLAPLAHARAYEQVCSAQGTRLVALGDADSGHGSAPVDHAAHCPLCMPVGAPPAEMAWDFTPVLVRSPGHVGIPAGRVASLVGAPFPARGPPSVS